VLERDTAGHPERCLRYRDFLVPCFAHGHELRAGFRSRHGVWGVIAMYRPVGRAGFTADEAAFLATVSGTVAEGLSAVAIRRASPAAIPSGPAVLTLGPDDQPRTLTPALVDYMDRLGAGGTGPLPVPVLAIAAAVRARRRGSPAPEPSATLRARSGEWLVLAGAPLAGGHGDDADVVVTIEQAQPPVVVTALGLTLRERDMVELVLAGHATGEIATKLSLSTYTVQDHLTSVFDKAGVRSRASSSPPSSSSTTCTDWANHSITADRSPHHQTRRQARLRLSNLHGGPPRSSSELGCQQSSVVQAVSSPRSSHDAPQRCRHGLRQREGRARGARSKRPHMTRTVRRNRSPAADVRRP